MVSFVGLTVSVGVWSNNERITYWTKIKPWFPRNAQQYNITMGAAAKDLQFEHSIQRSFYDANVSSSSVISYITIIVDVIY